MYNTLSLRALILSFAFTANLVPVVADDLWLADGKAFPGRLFHSVGGGTERLILQREATANQAFPQAAMKLGHVAMSPEGNLFFCSGLDGYVLSLLDGRNEVLSFEFGGQVRDIACGDEEHTVYFSVVPTPQNGEPLADGKIYRRDIWQGQPAEIANVRQADVGGNWWGNFTVRNGVVYLATFENPSRLFKLTSSGPEAVFTGNQVNIQGFTAVGNEFVIADGTGRIVKTTDFTSFTPILEGENNFTDVTALPRLQQ